MWLFLFMIDGGDVDKKSENEIQRLLDLYDKMIE